VLLLQVQESCTKLSSNLPKDSLTKNIIYGSDYATSYFSILNFRSRAFIGLSENGPSLIQNWFLNFFRDCFGFVIYSKPTFLTRLMRKVDR
jgi:hypothetical protein